jgi:hypothetical protein
LAAADLEEAAAFLAAADLEEEADLAAADLEEAAAFLAAADLEEAADFLAAADLEEAAAFLAAADLEEAAAFLAAADLEEEADLAAAALTALLRSRMALFKSSCMPARSAFMSTSVLGALDLSATGRSAWLLEGVTTATTATAARAQRAKAIQRECLRECETALGATMSTEWKCMVEWRCRCKRGRSLSNRDTINPGIALPKHSDNSA